MTIRTLLFIGAGSFLGGIARYGLSRWVQLHFSQAFPVGTMAVNLAGCLLIGVLYGLFDRGRLADEGLRLALTVGFCGGFTTFSTFAVEGFSMFQSGHFLSMGLYATLSFVLGLSMVYLGQWAVRLF